MICALASLALALIAVGEASPSQADDSVLRLTWDAPPGCPDLANQRDEIRRRIGASGRTPSTPVIAHGAIRAAPSGGYELLLRTSVDGTQGERLLAGNDCHQLAEAAALVLALLINPDGASSEPEPRLAVTVPSPPSPPASPVAARPRPGLGVGIGGVWATGVLPSAAAGLSASVFYQRGIWALAFLMTGFLPDDRGAPVLRQASASFYRLESALQLCAGSSTERRVGAVLCLGGAVVRLHGQSAGVSDPGQATAYWPEASLAGAGRLRLTGATHLRLAADLHGLGGRPDFAIAGLGSVYRPAAYNVRAIVGVDVFF